MKKVILKPIITEDMKKIYKFFEQNKEIYSKIPVSSNELQKLTNYNKKDIIKIIKSINEENKFKNIIIGSSDGYYFITKENILLAHKIIAERVTRSCSEMEYLLLLRNKLTVISEGIL